MEGAMSRNETTNKTISRLSCISRFVINVPSNLLSNREKREHRFVILSLNHANHEIKQRQLCRELPHKAASFLPVILIFVVPVVTPALVLPAKKESAPGVP